MKGQSHTPTQYYIEYINKTRSFIVKVSADVRA